MLHSSPAAIALHAARVAGFCACIALGLTLAGHGPLDENLVYSLGIGITSWLSIDLGRLWLTRHQEIPWPQGPAGLVLVAAGTTLGFIVGMALGNAYSGHGWTLHGVLQGQHSATPLIITVLASVAVSFFFHSQGKARFLIARVAQAQRDAAEARLKLLEAQLEPHMMFNTLANLRVLVATDPPRAQAMLDHFIAYLRATLGASRATLHPLADEFARLNDYLELMVVRMGPRLAFTLDLPAELQDAPVPPLLLQPLVENAIRHGLEPQVEGGHITVRAERLGTGTGAQLQLSVHDTGVGLPPGHGITPPASAGARHFGLQQVRERLATLYGADSTLELIAAPAGGTSATARFPLQTPAHDHDAAPCPDR